VAGSEGTDGLIHPPDGGAHDHHAAPDHVTISDIATVISAGSTANVDTTLPRSDYQIARVLVHGPKAAVGTLPGNAGYEGAFVLAALVSSDAMGHSARDAGAFRQYSGVWSKQASAAILSEYVFDSSTSLYNRYIAIQDAYITGSTLRLVMVNGHSSSATVWIKGGAILL